MPLPDVTRLTTTPHQLPILDARARFFTAAVDDGIAMSFAPLRRRSLALVELTSADGLVGYGESWVNYPAWAIDERRATLTQGVLPLITGMDAADAGAVRARLLETLVPQGRQWGAPGPIMQAISAVDAAMWDLIGKSRAASAAELAGGRLRDRVAAYASSLGPDDVAEQAEQCLALGLTTVKIKVGFGPETDRRNLRVARDVLGDAASIMVDANQAWTLDDALAMAPALRNSGVSVVEEPLRGDRVGELAEFHRRTGLKVATGENVYRMDGFADYIAAPEIEYLQPDVSKTGGLTDAIAISRAAAERGKVVVPHLYGGGLAYAATLQLAACVPEVRFVEYDIRHNPFRDPILVKPPRLVDGHIEIPDGPGLGVDLDQDRLAEYEVTTK